ncbi:hypothetical protein [Pedobacter sp. UBA5917]|jgi:hypothetical protein|uniref:hypothetical protein n=1 Tax=Pedobacter sp. UBA5917 TaxID=1947061 RepID=UPI0025E09663|nr:hypothetical protein [Pedobacter sp. UBA5917]
MNQFEETGGVRIGGFKATWPFGTLKVSEFKLELHASIKGKFVFKRSDIISIQPITSIIGSSIRINHRVEKYNKDIVFTFLGNAEERMTEIAKTGFLNNTVPTPDYIDQEISLQQQQAGFPIKIPVAIGVVVIWNLLILMDISNIFHTRKEAGMFGIGTGIALAFIFLGCLLLLISDFVRQLILKNGNDITSIRPFLLFTGFIVLVMFTMGFLPQYL